MSKNKPLKINGILNNKTITTDYPTMSLTLPVTNGVLENAGLKDGDKVWIIIKKQKKERGKA